jgi:4-hydroxybenzoate polyprenyltransferase/phosphoserine phosphatase
MVDNSSQLDNLPLCVDLDGTLIRTDSLGEAVFALIRKNLGYALELPWWLLRGKAYFKQQIAERTDIDAAYLPYNQELLTYLKKDHTNGRQLVLATASNGIVAKAVADHVGIFSKVVASDSQVNRPGKAKAEALIELFGEKGFVYAGNSHQDIPVWAKAAGAIVVNASSAVTAQAKRVTTVIQEFPSQPLEMRTIIRALRSYQWAKNALVFVPLLASHRLFVTGATVQAVLAAVAFSLAASGVYLLNDLLDLPDDRRHPVKRHRPLAAGDISVAMAVLLIILLWVAAGLVASVLPTAFWLMLVVYVALSFAYSSYFKRIMLIDVVLLALLYVIRIFAGATAILVPVSGWLLTFALFLFLSLALAKRFTELRRLAAAEQSKTNGRGYVVGDKHLLGQLGTASGLISVLVLTLYISSPEVSFLYRNPHLLWLIAPLLLYWISRIWLLAERGALKEDALVFALKDRVSYAVLLSIVVMGLLAL